MKKYIYSTLLAASLLLTSCEEVVDLNLDQHEKRLVINANLFTNEDAYNKIKLSYSAPFYADGYQFVSTATVTITNLSTNITYPFAYTDKGVYENNDFKPNVTDTYELTVLLDANIYKATTQVLEAPAIEKIEQINEGGFTGDSKEVRFYYQDDLQTEDYYLEQMIDNEENDFSVSSDLFSNGKLTSSAYFADKEQTNETIYFSLAKIDKAYYNYLSKLFSNAAAAGNPFATPTGTLKGNIINTTNENDFPLGYFHISKRENVSFTIQ